MATRRLKLVEDRVAEDRVAEDRVAEDRVAEDRVAADQAVELAAALAAGARAQHDDGDLRASRQDFDRAYRLAEQARDGPAMAVAALGLAGLCCGSANAAPSPGAAQLEARLQDVLALLDPRGSLALRVRALLAGEADYFRGEHAAILAVLDEARAAADPVLLAEALSIAHHCLLGPGHVTLRRELAAELIKASFATRRRGDLAWGRTLKPLKPLKPLELVRRVRAMPPGRPEMVRGLAPAKRARRGQHRDGASGRADRQPAPGDPGGRSGDRARGAGRLPGFPRSQPLPDPGRHADPDRRPGRGQDQHEKGPRPSDGTAAVDPARPGHGHVAPDPGGQRDPRVHRRFFKDLEAADTSVVAA